MKTVWKAELDFGMNTIQCPSGSEFLTVREQFDKMMVWFRCDPTQALVSRSIMVVGTGHHNTPETGRYLGLISHSGGALIWHAFLMD